MVVARFNELVTKLLLEGALDAFSRHGGAESEVGDATANIILSVSDSTAGDTEWMDSVSKSAPLSCFDLYHAGRVGAWQLRAPISGQSNGQEWAF